MIEEIQSGHSNYILSLATSPNGQYIVSGSQDNKIKIWKNLNYRRNNNKETKEDERKLDNNYNNIDDHLDVIKH